jgi:hypothetical protein
MKPDNTARKPLLAIIASTEKVLWWLVLCLTLMACAASLMLGDFSSPLWLWQAFCAVLWVWIGSLTRRVDRLLETCGTGREPDEVKTVNGVKTSYWYSRGGR